MISKKIPILGINQDDTYALVDTKEYLNALNLRFTTSENGKVGQMSTVEGNVLKNTTINVSGSQTSFVLPAGDNIVIGAYEDTPNKRVFFFNKNSNGNHGIYCYDSESDIVYTVLLSSQVKDGLNFSSFIHSVSMIDVLIYWTDGVNPQRRINVEAGIKTNHPTYTTSYSPYSTLSVGTITAGTSYTNGTYTNVPLTGGTGSGAKATIVVSGNVVTSVTITYGGTGYAITDSLTTANTNIGGTGSGFSFLVSDVKINQSVINLIRNQPAIPLTVSKVQQTSPSYPNNFIAGEAVQFMYRFVYRDYEVSTFSPVSDLCNYNTSTQLFNAIDVTIPLTQKIDQDVIKIELAVKYVLGGSVSIFKTITSGFQSHNNGTAITTRFYNDSVGIAVDSASAVKPFDSVPITSGTLEIAKNRLFLGDNNDGYESPSTTSLATTTVVDNGAALVGKWFKLTYNGIDKYIIYINGVDAAKVGYYYIPSPTLPLPTTYDFNSIPINYATYPTGNYLTSDELTVWNKLYGITVWPSTGSFAYQKDVTITNGPALVGLDGKQIFKSDSSYRLGVVFYDYAGRKCGVVTKDSLKMVTPDRTYSSPTFTTLINWTLSNTNSITEIPSWAHYYSVVMTKGLRASSFIQMKVAAAGLKYVTKDTTGEYVLENTYTADRYGIAIEAKSLFAFGLGYTYQAGDIIKLYNSSNSTINRLKVKDTFGEYIVADLIDMSSFSNVIYEVYSPYVESSNEPYYEVGETYPVTSPGTDLRSYSVTVGNIDGDVSSVKRTISSVDFLFEAMSPNDLYWQNWNRSIGRPNIVLTSKSAQKKTSIYYSNVVILGSETNGLSSFEALSQTQLPYELTRIRKLQLVSKVGAEGTVMLAIGEQETASVYLGEAQIFDNTGNSFLATTSGVIGNINILRGSYGTINPESVVRYMGEIYWFDANRGSVVRYSSTGLFPISSNKMQKYFRKVGQDVLTRGLSFYGGIDPYHNEVLMFAPRKSAIPESARLTDMTISSNTYNFTTVPAVSTITVVGQPNYDYSGGPTGPNQATVTGSTGPVTFTYTGVSGTSYGPSSVRPTQAGSYQVVATVASDGIYDAATSAPFSYTISAQFFFDADYMLLTYQFTDGLDLDTRTRIVTPNVGQDSQPKYVGWAVNSVWPTTGTPLLDWGGDNTGTGYESVLINVAQLKASYPSATTLVIDLRAFWYNTIGVQPVNVAATLWKGGTPIEQGPGGSPAYSFTNPTATATLNITSVGKQITSDGSPVKSASSGERVATLTYNIVTSEGSFNSNDTTTPSV